MGTCKVKDLEQKVYENIAKKIIKGEMSDIKLNNAVKYIKKSDINSKMLQSHIKNRIHSEKVFSIEMADRSESIRSLFPEDTGTTNVETKSSNSKEMNIYFSSGENASLSNLSVRPFVYDGVRYNSVEHGYQSLKSGKLEDEIYSLDWSKGGLVKRGSLGTKIENDWNINLMNELMSESFKQNKSDMKKLIDTGDAVLTHKQGDKIWKDTFPNILMEIRDSNKDIDLSSIVEKLENILLSSSAKKHAPKEIAKATYATQAIADGIERKSRKSTALTVKEVFGEKANTGKYTENDIVYISANGGFDEKTERVKPVIDGELQGEYKNIKLAMDAGAIILGDTENHLDPKTNTGKYNVGERELSEYMSSNGYSRTTVNVNGTDIGVWHNPKNNRLDNFKKIAEIKKPIKTKSEFKKIEQASQFSVNKITKLEKNQVFVFGSNKNGYHGAGAAKFALGNKWAVKGKGDGYQKGTEGASYAIPTRYLFNKNLKTYSLRKIQEHINKFVENAKKYPNVDFLVTPIGTGHAGYSDSDIAPMFRNALGVTNIKLPTQWEGLVVANKVESFAARKKFDEVLATVANKITDKFPIKSMTESESMGIAFSYFSALGYYDPKEKVVYLPDLKIVREKIDSMQDEDIEEEFNRWKKDAIALAKTQPESDKEISLINKAVMPETVEELREGLKYREGIYGKENVRTHELIHAVIHNYLIEKPNDPVVKYINKLFEQAKKYSESKEVKSDANNPLNYVNNGYWKENVSEFTAEVLRSPELLSALNKIEAVDAGLGTKIVAKIINSILALVEKVTGLTLDRRSISGKLIESVDELIEIQFEEGMPDSDTGAFVDSRQNDKISEEEVVKFPLANRTFKRGDKLERESLRVKSRTMLDNGFSEIIYYTPKNRTKKNVLIDPSGKVMGNGTGVWSIKTLEKAFPEGFGSSAKSTGKKTDQHEELKANIWNNSDDAKILLEMLSEIDGETDSEYIDDMNRLLEDILDGTNPVMNEFKVWINDKAEENSGFVQITSSGSEMILDVSKSRNGDMSSVETYMHEMIHMSVETALKYKKGAIYNVIDELIQLYEQARKNIKWQDLVVDGKEQRAKDQWNYMFDNDSGLSEFVALGMTNKKVKELLKKIEPKGRISEVKKDGLWGNLSYYVVKMYEAIRDFMRSGHGFDGDERLRYLASRIWEHNSLAIENNKLSSMVSEAAENMMNVSDKIIKDTVIATSSIVSSGLDKAIELSGGKDTKIGGTINLVQNVASLANPYMSKMRRQARNKEITRWSRFADYNPTGVPLGGMFTPESTLMTMINYLSDDDNLTTRVEKFGYMNQQLDSIRTKTIINVGSIVKSGFGDINQLQQKMLTHVMIENDVQSLLGKYSINEIKELMDSEENLEEAIQNERKNIDNIVYNKKLRNYIKSQSIGLGGYMATGISGSSIQKNAKDIFYMHNVDASLTNGIRYPKRDNNSHTRAIEAIDRLATLEALKKTNSNSKNEVSKLIESYPEAVITMLGTHRAYENRAKSFATENKTFTIPTKGEIKDTKESHMDSKIASVDEKTVAIMKKKGYKLVGDAGVKGLGFYVSSVNNIGGYDKQAVAKINEGKKLHNILGVLNIKNDGNLKESKIHADALVLSIKSSVNEELENQFNGIVEPLYDGYLQIHGKNGVDSYGVSISKELYESKMRQDNKAPILLGKMIAEVNEKAMALELNNQIYKTILDDMGNYKRGSESNRHDYIEIGPDSKNMSKREEVMAKELFENLPSNIRRRILKRIDGQRYIAVRRDLTRMYFGARTPSVLEMRIPLTKGTTVEDIIDLSSYSDEIKNAIKMGGRIWEETVSIQKVSIVLKTPQVLIDNVFSNFNYSIALGQNPVSVGAGQARMFKATKQYLDASKELNKINYEIEIMKSIGDVDKEKLKEKIIRARELNTRLKSNPVAPLMEAGMFTSIIEDIDDKDLITNNIIETNIEGHEFSKKISDSTPRIIKDGFNTLYMTEKTGGFRLMMMGTQYSDFVARANRYMFLTEEKGYSKDVAIKMILDEFVNYNRLDTSFLRWMNQMGFFWFTKYMFGANKSLINKLKSRPTSMLAMSMLLDAPNPGDASIFEKDFSHSINGPLDTMWHGNMNHTIVPSTLEIFNVV